MYISEKKSLPGVGLERIYCKCLVGTRANNVISWAHIYTHLYPPCTHRHTHECTSTTNRLREYERATRTFTRAEKENSVSTRCWIVDDSRSRADRDRRSLQDRRTRPHSLERYKEKKKKEKHKYKIAHRERSTGAGRIEQIKSNQTKIRANR